MNDFYLNQLDSFIKVILSKLAEGKVNRDDIENMLNTIISLKGELYEKHRC